MFGRTRTRVPWLRVTSARMQNTSMGRLPQDLAGDEAAASPAPEYVADNPAASEDAWARERAHYEAKNGPVDDG